MNEEQLKHHPPSPRNDMTASCTGLETPALWHIPPPSSSSDAAPPDAVSKPPTFLSLPTEVIDHIITYVPVLTLVDLSATCRVLREHANHERHWQQRFRSLGLPGQCTKPSPFASWKELFTAHHPLWFLPQHKLWFSDKTSTDSNLVGQLILSRYDPRTGNIEAYRLAAEHYHTTVYPWEKDPDVHVRTFHPRLRLQLDDPIVRLKPGAYSSGGRLMQEIPSEGGLHRRQNGIHSSIILTRSLPPSSLHPNMELWPPFILPARNRVRNGSMTSFRGSAHKPNSYQEISETTFRIRKWASLGGLGMGVNGMGVNFAQDVMTFSTLPAAAYTPTKERPYQGIWVGDYSTHGCEFLVVMHKTKEEARNSRLISPRRGEVAVDPGPGAQQVTDGISLAPLTLSLSQARHGQATPPAEEDTPGCTGRLEAVKLTGDPNVPRGEYTWIAEDIGSGGLIRVADEQIFRGARVVRSWGHVAERGFKDDAYSPTQLVLVSHDTLAQYWEESGFISFFRRLDINAFLDVEKGDVRIDLP